MPRATWNGKTIAQTEPSETQLVEGNVYFPPGKVDRAFLKDSATHTVCPWKGTASYYDVVVDGKTNKDAAWYYPETKDAAMHVRGHIAFWKGVVVN